MYKQYIGGELVDGLGLSIDVLNPASGEIFESYAGATADQALIALEKARDAFPIWSSLPMQERIDWMMKLVAEVLKEKTALAELLSAEAGKPLSAAKSDIDTFIKYINYYAVEVQSIRGVSFPEQSVPIGSAYHIVERRAAGVVVAYLPWNFPMYAASVKIGPSMASGCTCVLKPSGQTPLTTLKLGEIFKRIGLPSGVINIISGPSNQLGKALNGSNIPRMITLIGAGNTGCDIMKQGSTSIKRYSLELGGNAPVIIMEDADIDLAVSQTIMYKTAGSGQICIGFNRIYVHESVYDQYCKKIVESLKKIKMGYGHEDGIEMGPLINFSARDRMFDLINDAVEKGAKLVFGGEIPRGLEKGCFITPALITEVDKTMKVFQEEIFGPIIAVKPYSDYDAVIVEASDCDLGLTSYLFGHDSRKIAKAFEELGAGEVIVNGADSGPYVPHVGIKQSGIGCDSSFWSLEEYYDLRRLSVKP